MARTDAANEVRIFPDLSIAVPVACIDVIKGRDELV